LRRVLKGQHPVCRLQPVRRLHFAARGSIWTNNLLRLLELLDIGERAARSTLSLSLGMGDFIDELARVVE